MVDGTVLAGPYDYSDAPSGNEFYTYTVEIPKEIIAKAEDGKVTVRFSPSRNTTAMWADYLGSELLHQQSMIPRQA